MRFNFGKSKSSSLTIDVKHCGYCVQVLTVCNFVETKEKKWCICSEHQHISYRERNGKEKRHMCSFYFIVSFLSILGRAWLKI